MGRKLNGARLENKGFRGSIVLPENRNSQNLSLGLTSVWDRKSLKFRKQIKDCGINCADGKSQVAESELRVDLSVGEENH